MLFGGRARLSATLLGLAMVLGSAWWSAATTMTMLHDDAKFTAALSTALDSPQVRSEVSAWLDQVLAQSSSLNGNQLAKNPVVRELRAELAGDKPIGPTVQAAVQVAVAARDAAVTQLDAAAPVKKAVYADLAPLLKALKIKITNAAAQELGLKLDHGQLKVQVMSAAQLQNYQFRYDVMKLTSRFAGWAAALLLILSVVTSRRPLLTLAVGSVVAAVAAVGLSPLLGWIGTYVSSSAVGASLVAPLTVALKDAAHPYVLPTLLVAGGLALVCVVVEIGRIARHRAEEPPAGHAA